jgi:hypothetical protein
VHEVRPGGGIGWGHVAKPIQHGVSFQRRVVIDGWGFSEIRLAAFD